jgi:hypothetical protein
MSGENFSPLFNPPLQSAVGLNNQLPRETPPRDI